MSGYYKIQTTESDQEVLTELPPEKCKCCSRSRNIVPWIWCGMCSEVAVLAALGSSLYNIPQIEQIKNRPTDFVSALKIPYVEKFFYNYYGFNPNAHMLEFNDTGTDGKLYAGYPTKKIDEAWGELLNGTYMPLSDEEVKSVEDVAPWDLEKIDGNVYMEVVVFHNLHCLDLIRRALEPDHYDVHTDFTAQLPEKWQRVHIYHCVEQLRQAIQCQSDLTPVPLFPVEGPQKRFYATHGASHTCRDFEAVKRWRDERNEKADPFDWSAWS